ncbi:hypothetical protein HMPREF9969_1559 [Prevotella sp. oral taxon 306 str. F0472]|nr:hypothetical protein HMPREF9969_1559 [Prevotella sp. oral taxon 306 str. F0472]
MFFAKIPYRQPRENDMHLMGLRGELSETNLHKRGTDTIRKVS